MPELDPVRQDLIADATEWLATLDDMIAKAEAFAAAADAMSERLNAITIAADDAAVTLEAAASRANDLADAMARAAGPAQATAAALDNSGQAAMVASAGMAEIDGKLGDLIMLSTAAVSELHDLRDALLGVAVAAAATGAATAVAAAGAAAGGGGGGGAAGATGWLAASIAWWRQWSAVIHWAVMGTMEVLSTAIPALVAFGAAAVAMYPAVDQLKDHFSNLIISAGGLHGAIASMPGPMSTLASTMGRLSLVVAPDVWMMLGSAISIVTAHTGAFAGIAQQASDVLGNFAAKIVTDLQGPAGKALQDFFANGVKFMVQWGQVLGNFGRTFLNVFHAMPGIGHVVLDVLDAISKVLATITGIPVVGTLLGIVAAFSGLYRYANLVSRALQFMWVAFGGQALAGAIANFAMLTQQMGLMGAATFVARGAMTSLLASMGVIVPVAAVAVAGFELWYLNSKNVTDATKNLIQQVESAPNSIHNLSSGIVTLSGAMVTADQRTQSFARTVQQATAGTKMSAGAAAATKELSNDTTALSAALTVQYNKLKQVQQGLQGLGSTSGQVTANMAVMSIQIGLQDSKVSQLNQAWDAYLQLLTGGMSSLANFTTALGNMTTVSSTTGLTNLQQQTSQITLTAAQFQQQLASGAVKGASAWQNFTQVMTGSLGPTADYLRQAQAAGVITKTQFAQGILAATAAMVPYTGTTGTAANMLEAYAQQAGLGTVSLSGLQQQFGSTGGALNTLNGIMTAATIGMSNASKVAQNLSAVFSQQVTQALVAAALKANGFNTDVQNMMQAQATGMNVNGHNWQYWAQQAANAWNKAQTAATTATSAINKALNQLPSSKTITITVQANLQGSAAGYVASGGVFSATAPGGMARAAAATGGLVHGPGTGTSDSVAARLSSGEYVVRAAAVQHYGAQLFESLNARKLAAGGPASSGIVPSVLHATMSGGSGGGVINLHSSNSMSLGGRKILRQQRTEQLSYSRRNAGSDWSLRARTGTPR